MDEQTTKERTRYYLEAYLLTNKDVLEDEEIEELETLIKEYQG